MKKFLLGNLASITLIFALYLLVKSNTENKRPLREPTSEPTSISWFKNLIVKTKDIKLKEDFEYEIINDSTVITAPIFNQNNNIYFLRALVDDPGSSEAIQLYTINKAKSWLFLRRGYAHRHSLDLTLIEREFECIKAERDDLCVFEHVGINFESYEKFKSEAVKTGIYEFVLVDGFPMTGFKNKITYQIPRSYFRKLISEIEQPKVIATEAAENISH